MRIKNRLGGSPSRQRIEQFHEARLVRVTHGRFAIWLDPFRVLDPEVVVNLLPELRVSVDLMMQGRRLGERFIGGAGWFVWLPVSVSTLRSETNEFHKRPFYPSGDNWSKSARNEERSSLGTTHGNLTSDGSKAPSESGDRAKRCLSDG
jgi:hypothetical protein